MKSASSSPAALTPDQFRDVIGRFASGVTVITTVTQDTRFGATASAVSSVSLEPPMLLACINARAATAAAVSRAGVFAVNILAEDQDHLARRFARREPDKFRGIPCSNGCYGEPLLEDALAHLECRVIQPVRAGTHVVFIGSVDRAWAREGRPLAYFRGGFGQLNMAAEMTGRQRSAACHGLVDLGLMAA